MARPVRGVPVDGKLVCSWNHRVILDLSISVSNLLYTTKFFGGFDQLDLLTSVKPTGGGRPSKQKRCFIAIDLFGCLIFCRHCLCFCVV